MTGAQSTGGEPASYSELVDRLRAQRLTASQQKIANYLLANPEGVAFMTISELAASVGVNEATIVRFAVALGLGGYPALVRLCRQQLQEQAQLIRRFDSAAGLSDPASFGLQASLELEQANLSRTYARVNTMTFESAVVALADAPRVHIVGLRKCFSVAYLATYLLGLVRPDVTQLTPGTGGLVEQLSAIRQGDVVLAISVHRYTRETVLALQHGRAAGAHCITLTDNPSSALARYGHDNFFIDGASTSLLRSMTAFTSLVQVLAFAVGRRRGPEARAHLEQQERLLEELHVYYDEADSTE